MKISTKGRYALRFMLDLAMHSSGDFVRLKDISQRQEISEKYLEQISSALTKAGLIRGVRGSQGGYKLIKSPSEYTIGSILRATEGKLAPVACLEGIENTCHRKSECAALLFWQELNKLINDFVDGKTLQDLIDQYNGIKSALYTI
ncbi:MAG: Rrf2 family transcriptional regulator [Clostridiales bacterium]|nr:Rrf2 family transcriptional regulator [Clostridiales bacterium]